MKIGHYGDEIKFDAIVGTTTRYAVIIGGETVMHVLCDIEDDEKVIRVASADYPPNCLVTLGRFKLAQKFLEGPDGEPLGVETRVDVKSVYSYIVPRLRTMLGRLLRAATNPCAYGCSDPEAHAEGAHDL